jgi:endonuclease YncB( thermonuclease family)
LLTVIMEMAHKAQRHWCWCLVYLLCFVLGATATAADGLAGNRVLRGEVVAIADGDTLTLLVDATQYRVRLAQIDAPEQGQPWGNRARQALADKVFRQQVQVEVVDVDRYGRSVGQVWLQQRDINRELVSEGHAWVYRKYLTDRSLLENEASAKAAASGLWAQGEAIAPWQWRHSNQASKTSFTAAAGADCRIKGNISSKGRKIYHVPGQRYYDQTQISEGRGERWFCSETQARQAGWRRAKV